MVWLVMRDALRMVAIGIAVGVPVAPSVERLADAAGAKRHSNAYLNGPLHPANASRPYKPTHASSSARAPNKLECMAISRSLN